MDFPDLKATIALDGDALAALLEEVKGEPRTAAASTAAAAAAEAAPKAEPTGWTAAPPGAKRTPPRRQTRRW